MSNPFLMCVNNLCGEFGDPRPEWSEGDVGGRVGRHLGQRHAELVSLLFQPVGSRSEISPSITRKNNNLSIIHNS